jgi:trehalose-6-phosphate synthase
MIMCGKKRTFRFDLRHDVIFHRFVFIFVNVHQNIFIFSAGGLVTAVAPVVIKGKGLWVGWPGIHLPSDFDDETIPESDPSDQTPTAGLKSEQVIKKFILCLKKI